MTSNDDVEGYLGFVFWAFRGRVRHVHEALRLPVKLEGGPLPFPGIPGRNRVTNVSFKVQTPVRSTLLFIVLSNPK